LKEKSRAHQGERQEHLQSKKYIESQMMAKEECKKCQKVTKKEQRGISALTSVVKGRIQRGGPKKKQGLLTWVKKLGMCST